MVKGRRNPHHNSWLAANHMREGPTRRHSLFEAPVFPLGHKSRIAPVSWLRDSSCLNKVGPTVCIVFCGQLRRIVQGESEYIRYASQKIT